MHAHDCPSIPYVNPFIPCALSFHSFHSLYFVLSLFVLLCSCFMLSVLGFDAIGCDIGVAWE
jgi:hypothetical protein